MAVDGVEDLALLAYGGEGGGEGVLLARDPAFARVVDLGDVAGGGGYGGRFVELDEGRAIDQTLDVEGWERDEVVFVIGIEVEDGMADLLDVDGPGEGGFLGVVALKLGRGSVEGEKGSDMRKHTLTPCFSFQMEYAVTGG